MNTSGIVVPVEPKRGRRAKKQEGKGGRITTDLGDTTLFKLRALAEKEGVSPQDLVEKSVDQIFDLSPEKQAAFAKKASFPII